MIHRWEEWNGAPRSGRHIAFAADLETQHQVEIRQPRLAATFPRQYDRLATGVVAGANVRRQRAKALHPVNPSPDRVPVTRIVAREAGAGLVHVDAVHPEFNEGAN